MVASEIEDQLFPPQAGVQQLRTVEVGVDQRIRHDDILLGRAEGILLDKGLRELHADEYWRVQLNHLCVYNHHCMKLSPVIIVTTSNL